MAINLRDKQWWLGILVSFLKGGWGALGGGVGVSVLDPDHFNINEGIGKLAMLVGMSFLISGIAHAATYLAGKPLPPTIADELSPEDKAAMSAGGLSDPPATPGAPLPPPPPGA